MTMTTDREIGRLSAEVASLQRQVTEQGEMLREVRDTIVSSKGSWRMLLAVSGLAMTIGSFVTGLVLKFWPGN